MDEPRLVAVALLTSGDRVLVVRRPESGSLPGEWEFPGGKVEFGEHPWDALRRELKEELGLQIARGTIFGVYSHVYDLRGERLHYVLLAYRCPIRKDRVREREDRRWARIRDLGRWRVVPGSRPILADLRRGQRAVT